MSNLLYKSNKKLCGVRFKLDDTKPQDYIRVYFKNFMLDFPLYIASIPNIKYQLHQSDGYLQERIHPFKCYYSNDIIPPGEYNFIEIKKKKKFSLFRKKTRSYTQ